MDDGVRDGPRDSVPDDVPDGVAEDEGGGVADVDVSGGASDSASDEEASVPDGD